MTNEEFSAALLAIGLQQQSAAAHFLCMTQSQVSRLRRAHRTVPEFVSVVLRACQDPVHGEDFVRTLYRIRNNQTTDDNSADDTDFTNRQAQIDGEDLDDGGLSALYGSPVPSYGATFTDR